MITTNIEKKALIEKLFEEKKINIDEMYMLLDEQGETVNDLWKKLVGDFPISQPQIPVYPNQPWTYPVYPVSPYQPIYPNYPQPWYCHCLPITICTDVTNISIMNTDQMTVDFTNPSTWNNISYTSALN